MPPMKGLVVDDQIVNCDFIAEILRARSMEVDYAEDGAGADEIIHKPI